MVQILVNGKPIQLLAPIPNEIISLVINTDPFFRTSIKHELRKPITEWVYNISQSVTNIIMFNGIIVQKEDVIRPSHMKKES